MVYINVWNRSDWVIVNYWVFNNFILSDDWFAKALQRFEIGLSVNDNLCEKLISLSFVTIIFDNKIKVTDLVFLVWNCYLYVYTVILNHFILTLY